MAMKSNTNRTKTLVFTGLLGFCLVLVNYIEYGAHTLVHRNLRNEDENEVVDRSLDVLENLRPVMYLFFELVEGGCCRMSTEAHLNLISAWEEAWQSYGWDTRVLTKADAIIHPDFEMFEQKMTLANVDPYNRRCFWRWLAMALLENGGWMSDYDNIPLTLTGDMGLELMKQPGFKSWGLHVPALIHSDKKSLDILVELFKSTVSPDFVSPDPGTNLVTDMLVLLSLHQNLTEEEMGITLWENRIHSGFPYVMGDTGPKIDCDKAKNYYTAHLSHHAVREAAEVTHLHPIKGVTAQDDAEKRGDAARIVMRDYQQYCVNVET